MPGATNHPVLVFPKTESLILEVPWISMGYQAGEMNQVATNHPLLVFSKKSVILEVPWISMGYQAGEMNQVATTL